MKKGALTLVYLMAAMAALTRCRSGSATHDSARAASSSTSRQPSGIPDAADSPKDTERRAAPVTRGVAPMTSERATPMMGSRRMPVMSGGMPMMSRGMPMMGGGTMMARNSDTAAAPRNRPAAATAPGCAATSQALADAGRQIFAGPGNCYACHGSNARGSAVAPDLTDKRWLDIDGSYAAIVGLVGAGVAHPTRFAAPMPAKGGAALRPAQVCAVAAYVYSLTHSAP